MQTIQLALFLASLALAFAAVFLAWFRVKFGVIAIGLSIACWLGYESTIPAHVNIRVDLIILLPFLLAAIISTAVAASDEDKARGGDGPARDGPKRRPRRFRRHS